MSGITFHGQIKQTCFMRIRYRVVFNAQDGNTRYTFNVPTTYNQLCQQFSVSVEQ
jgi:hypothetical protein